MKKMFFLLILMTLAVNANPIFTIGSDPYQTIFAYPHDLLHWPETGARFDFHPQTLPWQGDVTQIMNRPSESYVNNYQNIEFAPPSNYQGDPANVHSWMKVSSYAYQRSFDLAGFITTKYGKIYAKFGFSSIDLDLQSDGVGRAYETVNNQYEYYLVPFSAATRSARNETTLELIYAPELFNQPFGIKVRHTWENMDAPTGYTHFTRDGVDYESDRLTWGWATTGCNHIFGYSHINTDAFFQNHYSVMNGGQTDIQLSFEIDGNYKTGIRYRRKTSTGESYDWQPNEDNPVLGNYVNDKLWKDAVADHLLRAYSKVRFWQWGDLDAGVLFFLQYASFSTQLMNKVTESDPASNEAAKEIIIETNPFVNYKFERGFLDAGLLLEFSRTGMRNSYTRWNSQSQSDQKDVLWSTTPYYGWSPYWENFSKGTEWFFATGFETYSQVSVYKKLSALLRLTVLKKYTLQNKIYGQSQIPDGEMAFRFMQTHERRNTKNETWMNGSIGFTWEVGPVQLYSILNMPLAYLVNQQSALDEAGEKLFEHEKRNMWQVQMPASFQLFFIYRFK